MPFGVVFIFGTNFQKMKIDEITARIRELEKQFTACVDWEQRGSIRAHIADLQKILLAQLEEE